MGMLHLLVIVDDNHGSCQIGDYGKKKTQDQCVTKYCYVLQLKILYGALNFVPVLASSTRTLSAVHHS